MTYILALDQGTTSCRAFVFDDEGRVRGRAQREIRQFFPHPGWVEHDPVEIWNVQHSVAGEAMAEARITAGEIAAIGITNQRETTLLWDRRTGVPISRAIVWQDRRTARHCDRLRSEGRAELFRERTGLVVDPYFSGTKLSWLLDHVEDARARAERGELAFGTIDSWLLWKLTGGRIHDTDVSNASRTLLYDLRSESWDPDLLTILEIPDSVLPAVRSSSEVFGETDTDLFGGSVPIAGMAGDQQAALFGQLCLEEGTAKNTYGTGCFLLLNTGGRIVQSQNQLISTVAWRLGQAPTQYALEGSVFIAGAAVQWLRDGLGIIGRSPEVETLAASVPDSGGVLFVPAFAGLGAPHWDADARGLLIGLTRGTSSAHIARATLEAIAHQSVDLLEAMAKDSGVPLRELRVDGGAAANDLLLQIQADLAGVPVVRPRQLETTVLGAAYLAGLAVGYWTDAEALQTQASIDRIFHPNQDRSGVDAQRQQWKRAVERAAKWNR
jgi:glycerol kinase